MTSQIDIPEKLRIKDKFHYIDAGFLNQRLCMIFLNQYPEFSQKFIQNRSILENDHISAFYNDHLLVTLLLDICQYIKTPTLLDTLKSSELNRIFCSTEHLVPCLEIYNKNRVSHAVKIDFDFGKPVVISYHTKHIVSDTGKMTLHQGTKKGYTHSIIGRLHDKVDCFEIEPLVIGSPWLDHPRNGGDRQELMYYSQDFGEILPEDIDQFAKMRYMEIENKDEWMNIMKKLKESEIKEAFSRLLTEPTKKDWGGESNDHFSASISMQGRRRTAAFLMKGPSSFREMTLEMCGKRADQIHRMVDSGADISIVQHAHLIGSIVRTTLKNQVIRPGVIGRKYCLIDGQATYRILKAYSLLPP